MKMTETRNILEAFPVSPESHAGVATLERPQEAEQLAAIEQAVDQMDPATRRAFRAALADGEIGATPISAESSEESEVGRS
jgi:hypothetical protein